MEQRHDQQQGGGAGQQSQSDYGQAAQAGNITGETNIAAETLPTQGGVSGLGDSDQSRSMDQQAGQNSSGASHDAFAGQIHEHMEVVDDMGKHIGTVDHVQGDRIKLARADSADGQHHYVLVSQIAGVENDRIRLRERGDNDFGMESGG